MEGFSPPSPGIHTAPTCLTPGEEVEQKTTPTLSQLWAQTHSFVPHNADNMCFSESLKNSFFCFNFHMCVWYACECMYVFTCEGMCGGPGFMSGIILNYSSTYSLWQSLSIKFKGHRLQLVSLTSSFYRSSVLTCEDGTTGSPHASGASVWTVEPYPHITRETY